MLDAKEEEFFSRLKKRHMHALLSVSLAIILFCLALVFGVFFPRSIASAVVFIAGFLSVLFGVSLKRGIFLRHSGDEGMLVLDSVSHPVRLLGIFFFSPARHAVSSALQRKLFQFFLHFCYWLMLVFLFPQLLFIAVFFSEPGGTLEALALFWGSEIVMFLIFVFVAALSMEWSDSAKTMQDIEKYHAEFSESAKAIDSERLLELKEKIG